MKKFLNFNSLILIISGFIFIFWGFWTIYQYRDYKFGGGIFLVGVGNLMFGFTNGFSDPTPRGQLMFRIGTFSYILGLLATVFSLSYLLR